MSKRLNTDASSQARHDWLERGVVACRALLKSKGFNVPPKVRVSIGWPKGARGGQSAETLGMCFSKLASGDGYEEIFITPTLGHAGNAGIEARTKASIRVLDVLAHELVHTAVGVTEGHKGAFKRAAEAIGLTGQMTATVAGPAFIDWAEGVIKEIGLYPAAKMDPGRGRPKPGSRLLKCECGVCGYVARVTSKWINEAGAPVCPADDEPMEVV